MYRLMVVFGCLLLFVAAANADGIKEGSVDGSESKKPHKSEKEENKNGESDGCNKGMKELQKAAGEQLRKIEELLRGTEKTVGEEGESECPDLKDVDEGIKKASDRLGRLKKALRNVEPVEQECELGGKPRSTKNTKTISVWVLRILTRGLNKLNLENIKDAELAKITKKLKSKVNGWELAKDKDAELAEIADLLYELKSKVDGSEFTKDSDDMLFRAGSHKVYRTRLVGRDGKEYWTDSMWNILCYNGAWMNGISQDVREKYTKESLKGHYVSQCSWTDGNGAGDPSRVPNTILEKEEADCTTVDVVVGDYTLSCKVHTLTKGKKKGWTYYGTQVSGVSFYVKIFDSEGKLWREVTKLVP